MLEYRTSSSLQTPLHRSSWAISALGADKIDQLFGPSKAQSMWATMRQNFGRTLTTDANGQEQWVQTTRFTPISAIDFSNSYKDANGIQPDLKQIIVSPEWTAQAAFAANAIAAQCSTISSLYCNYNAAARDTQDAVSMRSFLSTHAGPYAIGPGITNSRQGATDLGSPLAPASVGAMGFRLFFLD